MSVTANDLQNLIITSLSNADPTAQAGLQANVSRYWTLYNRQGVLIELQYWYVRREAIRYLMACINRQTDFMRRANSASRASSSTARQDMTSSGDSLTTSASVSNRSMASQSVDETNSSGSGASAMNRHNSQRMDDTSSSHDVGSGSNLGHQESLMASSNTTNGSTSDSTASEQRSVREVSGFHQRMNTSSKIGAAISLGVGLQATYGYTGEKETGTIMDEQTSQGTGASESKLNNSSSNLSDQSADQSSSSSFNADATSAGNMTASGVSYMRASSSSGSTMTGTGSGSMDSSGAGNSSMTANASRVSDGSGEGHSLTVAASAMNSTMERLHQRFLHLQELWKRANEMIAWFEAQRLNLSAYTFQTITIQFPDGLNADAANRFLVKTPFGLGLGR